MSSIRLISMLDKFGQIGLVTVVSREVLYKQGQNQLQDIEKMKTTGYSGEIYLTAILCLVGLLKLFL